MTSTSRDGTRVTRSRFSRSWAGRRARSLGAPTRALRSFVPPRTQRRFADVILLAVPLAAIPSLADRIAPLLAGKVVVDAGVPSTQRWGRRPEAVAHPKVPPVGSRATSRTHVS
ncbi:MAG: NAD(P)-binding domain-containing protein [Candidatus Eisenbacteria bacterium]